MAKDKNKYPAFRRLASSNYIRVGLLVAVTLIFTLTLYPNLVIPKHSYKLGDVVEHNIKAPKDFFVEDKDVTEKNRQRAVDSVLTVYDHDTMLSSRLRGRVEEAFADLRSVFEEEKEKQREHEILLSPENLSPISRELPAGSESESGSAREKIWGKKGTFEEKMGIAISDGAYKILENEEFSAKISDLINEILSEIMENGVVAHKELLLKESDSGIVLRTLEPKTERTVTSLKQFYGLDQSKTMVRIIGDPLLKGLNYNLVNLIVDFSQRLVQPNITLNRSETEERKKKAAAEIKPVLYKIKAGEMLLRDGERVTEVHLLKLKAMQTQIKHKRIVASSFGSAMIMLFLLLTTYLLCIRRPGNIDRDNNKDLSFIACVLVLCFLLAAFSTSLSETLMQNELFSGSKFSPPYGIPLMSGTMIICLFMGLDIAIPFVVIIAAGAAIIFQNRFEVFVYFLINGTMAAYWILNCRERKDFITAGIKIGLLNVVLANAINVYLADLSLLKILWDSAFAFLGGIGAGIITVGMAPLVEIAFAYTTDITLLELANLDQPILRRLMLEAPGTYHHSVIVGSLVEAAASTIGANPVLAKVCGFYHDIGKINKPLYFIENQMGGLNRHDKLAPSMSSLILIAHVKEGVETARKNKLGHRIVDTIKQHHGTSLISFFYDKAKQLKGEEAVNIDDFRYPGPRPQTKEAGLVMLADVVEATSRTLENPTPSRIQGLVQNLINKIFSDGQLDECELTLKDLHHIAKSFNQILNGIYHHRIEYSESLTLINGKRKDGSSDRQQAKQDRDIAGNDPAKSQSRLRRLGQS
ncbi:HD family phosphohydrolase [Thermodesulfobacteriota bacterium]